MKSCSEIVDSITNHCLHVRVKVLRKRDSESRLRRVAKRFYPIYFSLNVRVFITSLIVARFDYERWTSSLFQSAWVEASVCRHSLAIQKGNEKWMGNIIRIPTSVGHNTNRKHVNMPVQAIRSAYTKRENWACLVRRMKSGRQRMRH